MKKLWKILLIASLLAVNFSAGCNAIPGFGKTVKVSIVYGSEKQDWMEPLVKKFNDSGKSTADGSKIVVEAQAMGSIEAVDAIIAGTLQPVVWSPASSIYIPVANTEWQKTHSSPLASMDSKDLLLSPVVIAMWKPMAEALGYPQTQLGWADIARLATSSEGWASYGYPEWGNFKFGHTHPDYSNSGIVAIIAQTYAAVGKTRGLTMDDVSSQQASDFMSGVESSIIHYGTSTGFFATRMFERGPSYLSAAVMYENLIVAQETKRLNNQSNQIPVVAIYPREGTFWANHPYVILNAPWITDVQREAAGVFEDFLIAKDQQTLALQYGFRPADPSIPLSFPLDAQHGVDVSQPKTVLEIPKTEVIYGIQDLWQKTKKPVDLVIAIDTSGSMEGEKMNAARSSLLQFIDLLGDNDRLQVISFNTSIYTLSDLSPLGEKRDELKRRVSGIISGGDTSLFDTVKSAYADLNANADPHHIRAVVVLSDGQDTISKTSFSDLIADLNKASGEGGNAIKLFTIAYGDGADQSTLTQMADPTGGKMYSGDPKTIQQVYSEIATFF